VTGVDRTMQQLLAPPLQQLDEVDRLAVRELLVARLAPLAARLPAGARSVVTLPVLRSVGPDARSALPPEEPFAWKPAFVRRSLGLAVVHACVSGRFHTPAQAVVPVADEAVEEWRRTGWRSFHWEPWMAGLAPGARAVALADALTWATALWTSLDWRALPAATRIGGVDDQWLCPAVRTVRLKARAEVRVPLVRAAPGVVPAEASGSVLVSVSSGCPARGWSEELAYLALVAGLRSPTRPVPARVIGLWPDAGFREGIEVDRAALEGAVDRVVATVARLVDARTDSSDSDGGAPVECRASLAAA